MTVDIVVPRSSILHDLVGGLEGEIVARRLGRIPFHGVLRGNAVEIVLIADNGSLLGVVTDGQSSADI